MDKDDVQPIYATTIAEAAQCIGVHERTLKSWLAIGAPAKTDQGYEIAAIKEWREVYKRSQDSEFDEDDFKFRMAAAKLKEQEGKADKVSSEAVITSYKEQSLKHGLVHRVEVDSRLAEIFRELRRYLQQIPANVSASYAPDIKRQINRDCTEHIHIALRAMRVKLENLTGEIKDDD